MHSLFAAIAFLPHTTYIGQCMRFTSGFGTASEEKGIAARLQCHYSGACGPMPAMQVPFRETLERRFFS